MLSDFTSPCSVPENLVLLGRVSRQCALEGGPVAQRLYALVQRHRFQELIDFDFRPIYEACTYSSDALRDVLMARQIQALYSKNVSLELGVDRKAVALANFERSERMCSETNERIRSFVSDPGGQFRPSDAVNGVIHGAVRIIAAILGRVPSISELDMRFGPGANTNVRGSEANPRAKLSAPLQCSNELAPFVGMLLEECPVWADLHSFYQDEESFYLSCEVVPGRLMFVPKNAKTERSIMIEPSLNGFLQKGLGTHLKSRLAFNGQDLSDQSRNQRLACKGSLSGDLCTVDLSMASDCLSRLVVEHLLPVDWYHALSLARTGEIITPGGTVTRLEKFSSMGNGFTFELESLIFLAVSRSVCKQLDLSIRDVSVYGDDIIVPVAAYDLLVETLSYLGFSVNLEKSFSEGPFRESCGADYLFGFSIRPFYQRNLISNQTLFTMHNFFIRSGERDLAKLCEGLCNPSVVIFGPDGFGDGHLIGSYQAELPRKYKRMGWDGAFFETYTTRQRLVKGALPGDSVLPTYSVYIRSGSMSATEPFAVRGSRGYSKVRVYTHRRGIFR